MGQQLYWLNEGVDHCPADGSPIVKGSKQVNFGNTKCRIYTCSKCGRMFIFLPSGFNYAMYATISTFYLTVRPQKHKEVLSVPDKEVGHDKSATYESKIEVGKDAALYQQATQILRTLYGENAQFRDGQYEAIEATLKNKRTLIVQRTGWGKSLVYFVATTILRRQGQGVTMVVSPLLALMQNQREAASKLGLKCDELNSTRAEMRESIISKLKNNRLDLVLVTPETLFAEDIQRELRNIRIGLFVVDEAHCISDWGHDFRLDYCRLKQVIAALPSNVPLLATTATANDRVVNDLKKQFGNNVFVSRGPLMRDNLSIQPLKMKDKAERFAWLADNIPNMPGVGIIYCLTRKDCNSVSDFLNERGISAKPYYSSGVPEMAEEMQKSLTLFTENKIKVLVATIKLGMGFDKGDISFIIHYQMPFSVVTYYQQIGRAGRNINHADTYLMTGQEDIDIFNYFLNTAFPTQEEMVAVLNLVRKSQYGISCNGVSQYLNIKSERASKICAFLFNEGYIRRTGYKLFATPKPFVYDGNHYDAIKQVRIKELEQMREFIDTKSCYNRFIVNCLDDDVKQNCGQCINCNPALKADNLFSSKSYDEAVNFIFNRTMVIEPRKKWMPVQGEMGDASVPHGFIKFLNKPGICLSYYGDPGIGLRVKNAKYSNDGNARFTHDDAVQIAHRIEPFIKENSINYLAFVPSNRSDLVKNLAEEIADLLNIKCLDLLQKINPDGTTAKPQKEMETSQYQCQNAWLTFESKKTQMPEKVALIDDIVDSKWTLTICGYKLMAAGVMEVYPIALADSSGGDF